MAAGLLAAPAAVSAKAALAQTAPAARPPGLDELLQPLVTIDASMSPDGTRLAVLRARYVGGKRSALIHILSADNPKAPPYEIIIGDNDVIGIDWANEGRLMVTLRFDKTPDGKPTGIMRYNKIFPVPVTRLMFIGADGS